MPALIQEYFNLEQQTITKASSFKPMQDKAEFDPSW